MNKVNNAKSNSDLCDLRVSILFKVQDFWFLYFAAAIKKYKDWSYKDLPCPSAYSRLDIMNVQSG